jgi:hypothetical protein
MLAVFELEIKDTTNTAMSVSYLDLHIEIDNEGRLRTKHNDNLKMISISHYELPIYMVRPASI